MLKMKSKFIALFITILLVLSTTVFASDADIMPISEETNTVDTNTVTSDEQETEPMPEIRNDDLYIFDNNIDMDQLVDGNVFLFGKNITVSGSVNGSLYAFGDNITFTTDAYIVQSIYAVGNHITLDGYATDFYLAATTLDITQNGFAVRDLKALAGTFNFNGGVGRNANVTCNTFNFNTSEDAPAIVYGDLNYSSANELSLSEDYVQGEISYTPHIEQENGNSTVWDMILQKVINFCNVLLLAIVVFLLFLWIAPKFVEVSGKYIGIKKSLISFGIGILSTIIACVLIIVLLFSTVGMPLSLILLGLLILGLLIANSVVCISITYKLKEKFKYNKNYLTYIIFIISVLVIWLLEQIPYVGFVISIIVNFLGLGIILHYLFTKNVKSSSQEKVVNTNN